MRSFLLLLALAGLSAAAPLPFPKRPASVAPGDYTLSWHGAAYEAVLRADGAYECWRGTDLVWVGEWKENAAGVAVREYSAGLIAAAGQYPPPGFAPYLWDAAVLGPKHRGDRPAVWLSPSGR